MTVWNRTCAAFLVIVAFVLAVATTAEAAVVTRGPYLQMGSHNRIVVRWRTDVATNSQVSYGLCQGKTGCLSWVSVNATLKTEHEITLTGLSPNTRYYYAVGTTTQILAGNDANHFFVTSPQVGNSKATRIWVLGDSGSGTANARAVRDSYYKFTGTRHTDLWLMLGDNAYESGTDAEYQAGVFTMYPEMLRKSVLWPSLGNHDGASANSATQTGPYYDMFSLPRNAESGGVPSGTEAYFSYDYGNIHFIVLDSFDSPRTPTGAMAEWLRDDLLATHQDWIIAYWHHPPYSKGSHDSDSEGISNQMRENLLPILEDFGVDLVLTGHSHSYERSFLIDGHYGTSGTLVPSMILDPGDGRPTGTGAYEKPSAGPDPHQGTVYTVAGSSGKLSSAGSMDHPVMFNSLSVLGSLILDIDDNRLDATFLQSNGTIRDTFTIIKGGASGGAHSPTANAPVTSSGGDQDGFETNPTNAYADDGVFARDMDSGSGTSTSCTGTTKDKHIFYNYNFAIPSGATIEGIQVLLDAKADSTSGSPRLCAALSWNGGGSWTSAKTTSTLSTTEDRYVLGGATDDWSRSWSPGQFSNANFRVRVSSVSSSTSRDFDVDWVGVKVTVSGSGGSVPAPDIAVAPTSYNFGARPVNSTVIQGFTVSNTGNDDLAIGSSTLTGPNTSAFEIVSGDASFTLAPGASDQIEVAFTPTSQGLKSVTLSIPSDDPDEDPILIPLTGTGTVGGGSATGPTFEEVQQGGTANSNTVTTATSLLGVAGNVYLAAVSSKPYYPVKVMAGLGLTWTRLAGQCAGRNQTGVELWWAQGSATTGNVTATLGSTPGNALIAVARYSNVASTTPVDLLVSGNTNGVDGECSGGSDSDNYSFNVVTDESNSVVFGAVTMRTRSHTPGSGYTEQGEMAQGTDANTASLALLDRAVPTATSLQLNGTFSGTVDWAVIGVELRHGTTAPVPDIDGVPATHAFGDVAVGGNASQTFTIRNVGNDDLHVSGISLTGGDSGQFSITQGAAPFTIAPDATHNLTVRFAPTSGGTKATTLRVTSDDPDESPIDVSLGGVGTTAPDIAVAPASHNYGNVLVGTSVTRNFTVSNAGTGSLVVGASTLTGADAALFGIVNGQSGFTLAPGTSGLIEVRFSPSTQGPKTATLSIPSNDPNENPMLVVLTGAGTVGGGGSTTPTFEEVREGGSANSNTVTTTTSLLGVGGDVYLAVVSSKPYYSVTTVTGLGLTWTRLAAQCAGRNQTGLELWWAQGPATTGNVTATLGSTPGNAAISVARYSDVAATNPVGMLVAGNTNGANGECSGGTDSSGYSFSVATDESNAVVFGAVTMRTRTHTPGSGYVERIEMAQGTAADIASLALVDRTVPSVTSLPLNGTFSGTVDWAVIGVELRHAAAPVADIDGVPTAHAYGDVSVGANATETFVIRNIGNADLHVSSTSLVGGDLNQFAITQGGAPFTVAPGATRNLDVRFTPISGGTKTTTLRLASDDPDESSIDVALSGVGTTTPDIGVTPTSHSYGNVSVGSSQVRSFTVSNTGSGNLAVGASTLTGADTAAFDIETGQGGFTLAPGSTGIIDVRFSPLTEGAKSATLSIPSNDPNENPLLVSLDGTGVAASSGPPTFEEVREGGSFDSTNIAVTNMTAVAGHLYLAAVSTRFNVAVNTLTGMGLTWTRLAAQCGGREQTGIEVWWAQGNATSGTVTATLQSTAATAVMAVARYSGAAAANPVAMLVAGNTNGINGACSGGSDTSSYSFNVTTIQNNAIVFGAVATRTRTNSPGAGYSERTEVAQGSAGEMVRIAIVDRSVPSTTSLPLNGTLNGTADWAVIGVQVRP